MSGLKNMPDSNLQNPLELYLTDFVVALSAADSSFPPSASECRWDNL